MSGKRAREIRKVVYEDGPYRDGVAVRRARYKGVKRVAFAVEQFGEAAMVARALGELRGSNPLRKFYRLAGKRNPWRGR